ncbi:hypothetical protein Q8I65_16945 [Paenibacillus ottowii]|uniref:hypothetical protein n=1 Tax=Paenibacillus ottowii TaxID=2315729 RepID=UPI0027311D0F|nr:hypothetical protein [Paenibacillus ottowii]MDP1511883.1 hypothetical protein [Paenibacillus ottowii]
MGNTSRIYPILKGGRSQVWSSIEPVGRALPRQDVFSIIRFSQPMILSVGAEEHMQVRPYEHLTL